MDTLLLRHVAEIAVSDIDKPEEALKELAKTYADRNMSAAKGFAATAASILTTTVLPSFAKSQTNEDLRVVGLRRPDLLVRGLLLPARAEIRRTLRQRSIFLGCSRSAGRSPDSGCCSRGPSRS